MIYYLSAKRNMGVMQEFLTGAGRPLARHMTVVSYERLLAEKRRQYPQGTYIFTSIGQSLGSRDPVAPVRKWAIRLHDSLAAQLGPERVLNDPARSLPRFELLRKLRDSGLNRFKAYRAADRDPGMRFPVYLRKEYGTVWQAPVLLADSEAYESEVRRLEAPGLIAIEFCDTADAQGYYRKYGCFVVGDQIVPRHLFKSRNWLVKEADVVDKDTVGEERAYLDANPHAEALRRVCRMANISYGRIDYALLGGVPQIWEINATPQIVTSPGKDVPERNSVHEKFSAAFLQAMRAIDPQAA